MSIKKKKKEEVKKRGSEKAYANIEGTCEELMRLIESLHLCAQHAQLLQRVRSLQILCCNT